MRNTKGFTLIELMIALVLGSMLMAALFGFFSSNQKTLRTQDLMVEAEQNARTAIEIISKDLRLSGYKVPITKTTLTINYSSGTTLTVASTTGFTSAYPIYINNGTGTTAKQTVTGTTSTTFTLSTALASNFSAGDPVYQYVSNVPIILGASDSTFQFAAYYNEYSTTLTSDYAPGGFSLTVNATNVSTFKNLDWIVISNGINTEWSTVNGDSVGTTITLSTTFSNDYLFSTPSTAYNIDTVIIAFDPTNNKITRNSDDGNGAQEIAENIDYFRFIYFDESETVITNPDAQADPVLARSRIRKVNVQAVGIMTKDDPRLTADVVTTYDDGSTATDKKGRVYLENDIFLRNVIP